MIEIILAIFLLAVLAMSVWNGMNGRGYTIRFDERNEHSIKGNLQRITLVLLPVILLTLVIVSRMQSSHYQQGYAKLLDALIFIVTVGGLTWLISKKRK